MLDVTAIILAAGLSRRMGARNKLLLPVGPIPMIRHVVLQYRSAIKGEIIVITGCDAPEVEDALTGIDVRCVFNPDYQNGQQTSVAQGLNHCPPAEAVLIGLGDQPLLRPQDIKELLAAHFSKGSGKVSIPALDQDTRGNPIVIPRALRPQLTADPERPGCMRFTRKNPDMVQRLPLTARGFYQDIDTPETYANFCTEGGRPL